jgi:hypothetical protein
LQAKIYDMSNFQVHIKQRHKLPNTVPNLDMYRLPKDYFLTPSEGKGKGVLYPHEAVNERTRAFTGSVWLSEQFPRRIEDLM